MELFYKDNLEENIFILEKEEKEHIVKVLRKKEGDYINFTDGKGFVFKCKIIETNKNFIKIEILDKKLQEKHHYNLHIAIAPTKNIDRLEWFIEKSTEINIDEISPLICKNSERKITNTQKLYKKIISASKQSLTYFFPKLNNDITFNDFIKYSKSINAIKLIAHCQEDVQKINIKSILQPNKDYLILIGPEGDFRTEEILHAVNNGFLSISLGEKRLRTETAGLLCVSLINFTNQNN